MERADARPRRGQGWATVGTMPVNAPLPLARQLAVLDVLEDLAPGDRVLDVGCGTGELAIALADRGFDVLGIDDDAEALRAAEQAAGDRAVRFEARDASAAPLPPARLVTCIGSTHAFGRGPDALTGTLAALRASQAAGSYALLGEGFHRPPIPAAYAAFLGAETGIERTHAENVWACEASGFRCLHAVTASPAEWDDFEWAFFRRRGKTEWRDEYLRHGREVMGFGLYLLVAAPTRGG